VLLLRTSFERAGEEALGWGGGRRGVGYAVVGKRSRSTVGCDEEDQFGMQDGYGWRFKRGYLLFLDRLDVLCLCQNMRGYRE
jgi:hypothetical protein